MMIRAAKDPAAALVRIPAVLAEPALLSGVFWNKGGARTRGRSKARHCGVRRASGGSKASARHCLSAAARRTCICTRRRRSGGRLAAAAGWGKGNALFPRTAIELSSYLWVRGTDWPADRAFVGTFRLWVCPDASIGWSSCLIRVALQLLALSFAPLLFLAFRLSLVGGYCCGVGICARICWYNVPRWERRSAKSTIES
jgi:hypothetical protein